MIETGRYNQTPHDDRFYPVCNSGTIEDEFIFSCIVQSIFNPKGNILQANPTKFCYFCQLSCTELIIKLMNSQNFSVNSHLLKFVSLYVMICIGNSMICSDI